MVIHFEKNALKFLNIRGQAGTRNATEFTKAVSNLEVHV